MQIVFYGKNTRRKTIGFRTNGWQMAEWWMTLVDNEALLNC
jgi:hypothetical protein